MGKLARIWKGGGRRVKQPEKQGCEAQRATTQRKPYGVLSRTTQVACSPMTHLRGALGLPSQGIQVRQPVVAEEHAAGDVERENDVNAVVLVPRQDEEATEHVQNPAKGVQGLHPMR